VGRFLGPRGFYDRNRLPSMKGDLSKHPVCFFVEMFYPHVEFVEEVRADHKAQRSWVSNQEQDHILSAHGLAVADENAYLKG
jgi:hypothetical protein